jgi:site-specific recombinase XerD
VRKHYVSSRQNSMHSLRHYYASITVADGVDIKELAAYLGHGDPGFTLRLYTHMLPSPHERARKAALIRDHARRSASPGSPLAWEEAPVCTAESM